MDWLAIVQTLIQFASPVKGILDQADTNNGVVGAIKNLAGPVAGILEQIGASLFPKVAPEFHIAAAAMATFDPNITKWIQGALNKLVTPSPPLVVDGIYGPMTREAVSQFQANNGLVVDGWSGRITQGLLDTLLTKA